MAIIQQEGLTFDLPSRTGPLSFVNSSSVGENMIGMASTRKGIPVYLGLDHNEDVLATAHYMRQKRQFIPPVRVLVDEHDDITCYPFEDGKCELGSWVINAFNLGQADENFGLTWFYRKPKTRVNEFNGRSLVIPNFDGTGIKVNVICLDKFGFCENGVKMWGNIIDAAKAGRTVVSSIDWDAGMRKSPTIPIAPPDSFEDHLILLENYGLYDIDLVKSRAMNALLEVSGAIIAVRSPGFCYQPYAIYEEKCLLER